MWNIILASQWVYGSCQSWSGTNRAQDDLKPEGLKVTSGQTCYLYFSFHQTKLTSRFMITDWTFRGRFVWISEGLGHRVASLLPVWFSLRVWCQRLASCSRIPDPPRMAPINKEQRPEERRLRWRSVRTAGAVNPHGSESHNIWNVGIKTLDPKNNKVNKEISCNHQSWWRKNQNNSVFEINVINMNQIYVSQTFTTVKWCKSPQSCFYVNYVNSWRVTIFFRL